MINVFNLFHKKKDAAPEAPKTPLGKRLLTLLLHAAIVLLVLVIILAVGVFLYARYTKTNYHITFYQETSKKVSQNIRFAVISDQHVQGCRGHLAQGSASPAGGRAGNLGLNLATVRWLGMYGVLLSSVVAIVAVEIPWLFHNLFQEVFPRRYLWPYARFFCGLVGVALASCAASWIMCSLLHLGVWASLIVNACVSFLVPNLFFFALYGKKPLFRESIAQIRRVLLKK